MKTYNGTARLTPRARRLSSAADRVTPWAAAVVLLVLLFWHPAGW